MRTNLNFREVRYLDLFNFRTFREASAEASATTQIELAQREATPNRRQEESLEERKDGEAVYSHSR